MARQNDTYLYPEFITNTGMNITLYRALGASHALDAHNHQLYLGFFERMSRAQSTLSVFDEYQRLCEENLTAAYSVKSSPIADTSGFCAVLNGLSDYAAQCHRAGGNVTMPHMHENMLACEPRGRF